MTLAGDQPVSGRAAIRRLLQEAEYAGSSDVYAGKRAATRFTEGMQLEVADGPVPPASPWSGVMHNVSEGGFAFHTRRAAAVGDTIYIREFNPECPTVWLRARVRHSTRALQGYLIGASFLESGKAEPSARGTEARESEARLPRPV
jgi:hypothetical protein